MDFIIFKFLFINFMNILNIYLIINGFVVELVETRINNLTGSIINFVF